MLSFVTDTHAFIWHLFDDHRLSASARAAFVSAAESGSSVGVSSITLAEIVYLIEKGRIPADTLESALGDLIDPERELVEVPMDFQIVLRMRDVSRKDVPDLPDRIVAATGLRYEVPVISKDARIRAANLKTIW